jgi:trehalose 6-phosphate phosphatase
VPGLLVCSGSTEVTALAERADLVVDGPDGVVAWLDSLAAALADRDRGRDRERSFGP